MNTIPQIQQPIPAEKRCTKCGVVKSLDEFYERKDSRDGRRAQCRACQSAAQKALWISKHPPKPPLEAGHKRCMKCGVVKPLAEFHKHKNKRDGRQWNCRSCKQEYYAKRKYEICARVRAWEKANREKKRAWRKANAEKLNAQQRARRMAHPERVQAMNRAWREANPERARAKVRAWYRVNRERVLAKVRAWNKANPEKLRARIQAWREANPEKKRATDSRRRARKYRVPFVDITAAMKVAMYQDQGGRCFYCREDLNGSYHVEHKIPYCRGGHHTPDNVCLSCRSCNLAKYTMTDVEFFARRAEEEKVA